MITKLNKKKEKVQFGLHKNEKGGKKKKRWVPDSVNGDGTGTGSGRGAGVEPINARCRLEMYLPSMGACVWLLNEGGEDKGRCRFGGLGEERDTLCRFGCSSSSSSEAFE